MIKIHSNDPGVKNNAVALLDFREFKSRLQYRLTHCCLHDPELLVRELKGDVQATIRAYTRQQRKFAKGRDLYVAERYMVRGRFGGNQVELVSFMLALTCNLYAGRQSMLLSAATWKNAVNRVFDLDQYYAEAKKLAKIPPHAVDAVLIGFYGAGKQLGVEPYKGLKSKTARMKLLRKIAKCLSNAQ